MQTIKQVKFFKVGMPRGLFFSAIITISFAAGILIGYFSAHEFAFLAKEELSAYWQNCFSKTDLSVSWIGIVQTVLLYAQCTVFLLLLCKTKIGVAAIPLLCVIHGFLLSFSFFSFSSVLGLKNIAYLAVLFSARLLFWLPCIFHIATVCFRESCRRCCKGKVPPSDLHFGKIPLLLLFGLILELLVIPQLMLQLIST